jgi:hypothetical protein
LEARAVLTAEVKVTNRQPLALPAPVEVIEIPGMTTISAIPDLSSLPIFVQAMIPSPAANLKNK